MLAECTDTHCKNTMAKLAGGTHDGAFRSRTGKKINKMVNPYGLTADQRKNLVEGVAEHLRVTLHPGAIFSNPLYKERINHRVDS